MPAAPSMADIDKRIKMIMADPCTSHALKDTLQTALDRDPVDALLDAKVLLMLLKLRLEADPDFVKGADR